MTLRVIYAKLNGSILADISDVATLLPIDLDTLATIQDIVDFGSGEWTYLALSNGDGSYVEEVKVTDVSGDNLVIVRGASMSTPRAFTALNTVVTNVFGLDAIKDTITEFATPPVTTVSGSGVAAATLTGNNYDIAVPAPVLTGEDGIVVTGTFPNFNIAFEGVGGGCCSGCGGSSGSGGVTDLTITSDILQGSIVGPLLSLSLQTPNFTGAGGIVVTGTYPDFTFTGPGLSGGTVTSIAVGTGLSITGDPTINPTLSITNTGVVAGDYNGVEINAQGQFTAVPAGWTPLNSIVFDKAITVVPTLGDLACTVADAAVGVEGVIALADSGSPLDPTDDATAVTPKVLGNALAALATSAVGAGSSTGEADGDYTNSIGATTIAVDIPAGKSMAIFAECEMLDGGAPLTPVAFGMSIFRSTGPAPVYKSKKATQSKQSIVSILVGPLNDSITLVTTAVPGGSSVYSQSLIAIPLY